MVCNCNNKSCPECCGGWVNTDAILDPVDRERIEKKYQRELKVLELKSAFSEFSYSCRYTVEDPFGERNVDPFDFRVTEKVVGDAEKFKILKKLVENF